MSEERSSVLPQDEFSISLRKLTDNPGAVRAQSTINRIDFYGRTETWVLDTFRHDGQETVFVQRISATDEPLRFIMPPEVTKALGAQRGRVVTSARKRGARKAAATREALGIRPAFLSKGTKGGRKKR
jgi:hypothetical protein